MSEVQTLPQRLLGIQKRIGSLTKDSDNPYFQSKYADLNQVLELAKKELNPAGILVAFSNGKDSYGQYTETSLIEADSGVQLASRVYHSGTEDNMQKVGAATTYAKRQGLKGLLAMEEQDDDGNTAVGKGTAEIKAPKSAKGAVIAPGAKAISPRNSINEKITLTSRVLIDSKRKTQEEVVALLVSYGVKTKEELNDDQAAKLLSQLEEGLK